MQFLEQSIAAVVRAVKCGKDIRGYFHWTLMDNFEWSGGFKPRLGLYYTNFETLQRFPKASALWYRDFLHGGR